jgi:hypothetical protein
MSIAARGGYHDRDHRRALQFIFSGKLPRADNFADVSMQSCLMGAPQLADWMNQHPSERLAAWRCLFGKKDGRGA